MIRAPRHVGVLSPVVHAIPVQLLAYHAALARGTGRAYDSDGLQRGQAVAGGKVRVRGGGFTITKSALTLNANVPGIDRGKFEELARAAEKNCPVSKVLNAEITMDFTLA